MAKLHLSLACGPYDRTQALRDGTVRAEGIEITYISIESSPEIFARMALTESFDVAEMSLAHYLTMRARGRFPFMAIPVFPSRVFHHGFIFVHDDAGIESPKDLAGKRIGLRDHRHTAAVWIRGILRHEYGVDLDGVRWFEGGVNAPRPRHAVMEIQPDRELDIRFVSPPVLLSDMLGSGELDAIFGTIQPHCFGQNPHVRRLFADPGALERDYFRRTGIFPIMHTLVMKESLNVEHPWVAESLYKAFEEAKQWALDHRQRLGALRTMLPWLGEHLAEIDDLFGGDAWPYGIEANRATLETLVQYLAEQGYLPGPRPLDDLFTPIVGQSQRGPRDRH